MISVWEATKQWKVKPFPKEVFAHLQRAGAGGGRVDGWAGRLDR